MLWDVKNRENIAENYAAGIVVMSYGGHYINLSNAASKGVNYAVFVPAADTYMLHWWLTTAIVLVNASMVGAAHNSSAGSREGDG